MVKFSKKLFVLQRHFKTQNFRKVLILERLRLMIRERNYLHSESLHESVLNCSWYRTYRNGSDSDMIAITSLNRQGFEELLSEFSKHFPFKSGPGKAGRPPRVRDRHCILAIVLHFYCSPAEGKTWQELFGVTPSTLSRLLDKAEEALYLSLPRLQNASIRWPTLLEQVEMAERVKAKAPLLKGRWGFIDGKNFRVESPTDSLRQNAMYNGWLHCVFVTGCMCFLANGLCCWVKHNYFGSWNDGEMSKAFREKLTDPTKNVPGHGVVSDTAFPVTGDMFGRIITPLKQGDLERAARNTRLALRRLSRQITYVRQAAEWSMGAVPKVYRILEKKLPFNPLKRSRRLNNLFRLYNFRVRTTGISQVRNFFYN